MILPDPQDYLHIKINYRLEHQAASLGGGCRGCSYPRVSLLWGTAAPGSLRLPIRALTRPRTVFPLLAGSSLAVGWSDSTPVLLILYGLSLSCEPIRELGVVSIPQELLRAFVSTVISLATFILILVIVGGRIMQLVVEELHISVFELYKTLQNPHQQTSSFLHSGNSPGKATAGDAGAGAG